MTGTEPPPTDTGASKLGRIGHVMWPDEFDKYLDEWCNDQRVVTAYKVTHAALMRTEADLAGISAAMADIKAERDRLATALVAANADLVTERAAHAEIKAQLLATQQDRYRIMCQRDEAERKLARIAEIVDRQPCVNSPGNYVDVRDYVPWAKELTNATTSDAPAVAEQVDNGPAATVDGPWASTDRRSCSNEGAAGPASKPGLVVGQPRVGVHHPECVPRYCHEPNWSARCIAFSDGWRQALGVTASAKADEGKACVCHDSLSPHGDEPCDCPERTQPAPPALTCDSTPNDWRGLKIHVFNDRLVLEDDKYVIAAVDCADILRAALKEAP